MSRARVSRIQDSVHGLMEFNGLEALVVDVLRTPELQRLRRVRQLGLAYFVFPGAEHSRLVHCLGASHLAVRFGRHLQDATRDFLAPLLRPTPSAICDLALAALCHDLGHGPLSHAWEHEIVGRNFDRKQWFDALEIPEDEQHLLKHCKWHELIGHGLLAWEEGALRKLLADVDRDCSKRIRMLLRGRHYLSYLPGLLHGDVDVDRADFIKRDAHQTGVAYGRFDLDWMISTCSVAPTKHGKLVIGYDQRKSLRVVEQFLIAHRALYETVYYHKTVHAAEKMVALFLRRLKDFLKDEGKSTQHTHRFVRPLVEMVSGRAVTLHDILSLDDFSLWVLISDYANSDDKTLKDLGRRILARDLLKQVPCTSEQINEFHQQEHWQDKLRNEIAPFVSGDANFYWTEDNVATKLMSTDEAEQSYFISDETGTRLATPMAQHSDLYKPRQDTSVRLYTVREAVSAVASLVRGKSA